MRRTSEGQHLFPTRKNIAIAYKTAMELRAAVDIITLPACLPLLRNAPKGDGHPVFALPGFGASDGGTKQMRKFLYGLGYRTHAWSVGQNLGPMVGIENRLVEKVDALSRFYEQKITLIGWSLGGLFARFIAHKIPNRVRAVISLGSPFSIDEQKSNLSPILLRLVDRVAPERIHELFREENLSVWRTTPPVPTTSIFSYTDGAVHYSAATDALMHEESENVWVPGSHCGLTHNIFVFWVLANRLAQLEGEWQPYESAGLETYLRKMIYPLRRYY